MSTPKTYRKVATYHLTWDELNKAIMNLIIDETEIFPDKIVLADDFHSLSAKLTVELLKEKKC